MLGAKPTAERWDWIARLLALHGEACAALALLRTALADRGAWLEEVASRQRELSRQLLDLAKARGAPRDLRAAAKRHVEAVGAMLA